MRSFLRYLGLAILLGGCGPGTARSCNSCVANAAGADWVVVKMDLEGRPYRCWMLKDTSIANESQSDGIYWNSPDGHLVHVGGHYNRVQVKRNAWDVALQELGLNQSTCEKIGQGHYDLEQHKYLY